MESTVKCISFDFMAARTSRWTGIYFILDSDRTVSHISQTAFKKEFYVYVFFLLGFGKIRHVWKTPTPPDSIVKMRFKFKIRKFFFFFNSPKSRRDRRKKWIRRIFWVLWMDVNTVESSPYLFRRIIREEKKKDHFCVKSAFRSVLVFSTKLPINWDGKREKRRLESLCLFPSLPCLLSQTNRKQPERQ